MPVTAHALRLAFLMNWFNTIAILVVAYLAVFAQATVSEFRHLLGVQVDLMPSLVVYSALSGGVPTFTVVAACGGLWIDSLSANPLGISLLPLFLVGLVIHQFRELILRQGLIMKPEDRIQNPESRK